MLFAIASGVAGAHFLIPGSQSNAPIVAMEKVSASNPVTGVAATVSYGPRSWGTAIDVKVTGVPAGTSCTMWAVNADGEKFAAGSWSVPYTAGEADYPASASLPAHTTPTAAIGSGAGRRSDGSNWLR